MFRKSYNRQQIEKPFLTLLVKFFKIVFYVVQTSFK